MTAPAAPAALTEDAGIVDRLRYPISPDYCRDWTVERALTEVVANALDEVDAPTVTYRDGRVVIADDGPGMPRKALVLGVSTDNRTGERKADDQRGTFGEGLKIASLVLARTGVPMRVETVGYAFEPVIVYDSRLECDVLQLNLEHCARERGTVVTAKVPERVATEVRGRFLNLSGSYEPPHAPGRVLLDRPGRVYLGGVYVQDNPNLALSYDLALSERSKRMINRDRTVLDASVLGGVIGETVAACTDEHALRCWLQAAFDGALDPMERRFQALPEHKARFRRVAATMVDVDRAVWIQSGHEEQAMDLRDNGYTVVEQVGDRSDHWWLMNLLGIEEAKVKQQRRTSDRQRQRTKARTVWSKDLTDTEQSTLDQAVALGRSVWGQDAVGAVKVFDERIDDFGHPLAWNGFYQPQGGVIALHRPLLTAGLLRTLEVLLHEAAHRVAHRSGNQWEDRTRGFERALGDLGARALMLLANVATADSAADEDGARVTVEALGGGHVKRMPRDMMADVCARAMAEKGIKTIKAVAFACGMSATQASKVLKASDTIPVMYAKGVAAVLDLPWAPLWLTMYSQEMPTRRRRRDGHPYGANKDYMGECLDELARMGGEWARIAEQVAPHYTGSDRALPFVWADAARTAKYGQQRTVIDPDEPFLEPYRQMMRLLDEHLDARQGT